MKHTRMKSYKQLLFVGIILLMTSCTGNKPAVLTGVVLNSPTPYVTLLGLADSIPLDADGSFRWEKQLEEPTMRTFTIQGVRTFKSLWLEGGKTCELTMDANNPDEVTIKGSGEKELPFAEKLWTATYEWQAPECENFKAYAEVWEQFFEKQNKETAEVVGNPAFTAYMAKYNHQLLEGKKKDYAYVLRKRGAAVDSDADFNAFMRSIDLNDVENTKNNLTFYYLHWKSLCRPNAPEWDYYAMLQAVAEEITNQEVRDEFGMRLLRMYLTSGELSQAEEAYRLAISITSPEVQKRATEFYNNTMRPAGSPAPDFDIQTPEDKLMRFHDICDKNVVYIDIWSTWCGPCCAEIPYVAKLVKHYKDNPNIKFVSISIDHNLKDWKKFLKSHEDGWEQYVIPNDQRQAFLKLMAINGIPRFMLFDKDRKIITLQAPYPSSENMTQYLDSVIQTKR